MKIVLDMIVNKILACVCIDLLFFSPLCLSGNRMEPPSMTKRPGTKFTKVEKKTIRGKGYDSDSDSEDD